MYQQLKRASMALTLSSVCFLAFAQKTIQGTVKDANGDPMIGVTITDQNGKAGGITDLDGKFTIQNADPNAVLTFSYIGCKPKKVKVGSQKTWNIVLEDDNAALDEVVVVGYGTMRKRDVTGSIASVNSEKIAARGTTNLAESLQGSVPGVNITQSGSRAGAGFNIQVRGQASINKQAQPLYVIDGVVCDNMDFLNPDDIDRIDVLKDASSTAIYGSRASAGVIMITTKGSKGADKAQKATISYDGYYGIKKLARMPEFMDANEFMDYRFARYTTLDGKSYDGSSRKGVDADGHPHYIIKNTDLNSAFLARKGATSYKDSKLYELMMDPSFDGYDWKKMVTRTAAQQNHFISAAGATDKINYRVGMGYQGEENVFKGNDYERFNLKGAMDAKLNKVFDAGFSVNLSMSKTEDVCTDGTYSPYVNAFYFNPFVSPTDADGNLIPNPGAKAAFGSDAQFTSTYNPLIDLNEANYNENKEKFESLWTQIATRFKNYDQHLLFEGYNEMLDADNTWNAPKSASSYKGLNGYAQSFVNAVRATGGNNETRNLIVNTYAAANGDEVLNNLTIPTDKVEGHIAVEVHTYAPWDWFAQKGKWDASCSNEIKNMFTRLNKKFISKGIPCIIGEYGTHGSKSVSKNSSASEIQAAADQAADIVKQAKAYGVATFYWMSIFSEKDRTVPQWTLPTVVEAMKKAYNE